MSSFALSYAISGCTGDGCAQDLANMKCLAGTGADMSKTAYAGISPIKEGEVCLTKAVTCESGKDGEAVARCKAGKCIGTESCGAPLPDKPYEIPGSTPTPSNPPSSDTPSTGGIPNPIPSTSSGSGGASGSGSGGGTGGTPTISPDGQSREFELVRETPPATSKPGSTFTNSGSSFQLNPRSPSWGSGGLSDDGVYSGGNPFSNPDGTTFDDGSWGSSGSGASANLFSNFVSGFMSLVSGFSGFWGGGGGSSAITPSQPAPPQAAPSQAQDPNQRAQDIIDRFQQRPDSQAAARRAEEERQQAIKDALKLGASTPFQAFQSQDRTGLPAPGEKSLDDLLHDMVAPPTNPHIPSDIIRQQEQQLPTNTEPTSENRNPVQVAQNGDGTNDASPPLPSHPDWWTPQLENTFAAGIESGLSADDAAARAQNEFVEGVYAGLADGRLAPDASDVGLARRILEEDVATAERIREREYMTYALPFYEQIDKFFSVTPQQRAVDAARARLSLLSNAEATARLGQYSGSMEPPVTKPFDTTGFVDIFDWKYNPIALTAKGVNKVVAWWSGPAVGATVPTSVPEEPRSGLLAGLSSVAARVTEATRSVAARFGFGASVPAGVSYPEVSPPPSIPSAPTPAPNVPVTPPAPPASPPSTPPSTPPAKPLVEPTPKPSVPAPSQPAPPRTPSAPNPSPNAPTPSAPAQSGGLVQSGINLISLILQSLGNFFTGSSGGATTPTPAETQQPTPIAPAGSITANPAQVDSGEQSKLSWSSVGTQGCAVIDGSFDVLVRGGTTGDLISPSLTASARFGLVCDIAGGKDKFVNETLVRVKGDASDPPMLFPYSGSVSQAVTQGNVNVPAGTGSSASTGSSSSQPNDVRTCDPEQSIDSFIHCLCQAEPNSNGCTIPPGGK